MERKKIEIPRLLKIKEIYSSCPCVPSCSSAKNFTDFLGVFRFPYYNKLTPKCMANHTNKEG